MSSFSRVGCRYLVRVVSKNPKANGCYHYENEQCDCKCHEGKEPSYFLRRHFNMRKDSLTNPKAKMVFNNE